MNVRQQRFVSEYLVDGNATAAYLRAGYKAAKRRTAESVASEMLRNPEVKEAIEEGLAKQGKRIKATADRVLQEIEAVALVNATEFAAVKTLAGLRKLPVRLQRAVTGWNWTKSGKLVLKLSKEGMLTRLGSHHKLFTEVVEHRGIAELGKRLDAADKRTKKAAE